MFRFVKAYAVFTILLYGAVKATKGLVKYTRQAIHAVKTRKTHQIAA